MSKLLVGVLLAVFAGLLSTTPSFAERRVALVVANQSYADAPLANPRVDAGIVTPALEAAGFLVTTIVDADLDAFDKALYDFKQAATGADVALFYFSGHGFAVADGIDLRTMLMATSADLLSQSARVLRGGGISLEEIILDISSVAKTSLFFVDACRNDPKVRAVGGGTRVIPVVNDVGAHNIFIGLSTRLGSTASDGLPGQGTAFARAFAENIVSPGVRIEDQFRNIRRQVEQETSSAQRPEIGRIDLDEDVVLVAAIAPQDTTRSTAPLAFMAPCNKITSNVVGLEACVAPEWVSSAPANAAQEFSYLTEDQNFGLMVITEKDVVPAQQFREAIITNAVNGSGAKPEDVKITGERIVNVDGRAFDVIEYTIPNEGNPILFQNFYHSEDGFGSIQILGYSLERDRVSASERTATFLATLQLR